MDYIPLKSGDRLPPLQQPAAFKTVLIVELNLTHDEQYSICDWLLAAGCVYVMVTGLHSVGWTRMLDATNLARFNFGAIPDKDIVIATDHPGEMLADIFWFSRHSAMHPLTALDELVCLHISDNPREAEIRATYATGA